MWQGPDTGSRQRRDQRARTVMAVAAALLASVACAPEVASENGNGDGVSEPTAVPGSSLGSGSDPSPAVRAEVGAYDPAALLGPRADGPPITVGVAMPVAERELLEERAGTAVPLVRVFARWDTSFPTADQQAVLDSGRSLHLSVRPRTDSGVRITWAEVASAQPGTEVWDDLDRWTKAAAAVGSQLYLTFNHEPETGASDGHGTPAEYRAAWRAVVERLRANGGANVRTVLVLGRGAYSDGSAESWYPGDDVVDIVGVDAYNWFDCQHEARPRRWIGPAELLAPALDFARAHGKPLAIPEIASVEDPADALAKANWTLDLARVVADAGTADQIEFVAWYGVADPAWPNCRWAWDSSPASAQAVAAAVDWLVTPG